MMYEKHTILFQGAIRRTSDREKNIILFRTAKNKTMTYSAIVYIFVCARCWVSIFVFFVLIITHLSVPLWTLQSAYSCAAFDTIIAIANCNLHRQLRVY